MKRPDDAINAYLDGRPTPQQVRALEAWINEDAQHARDFFRLMQLHHFIGDRLRKGRGSLALRLGNEPGPNDSAAALALAELARLHEEGLGQAIDLPIISKSIDQHAQAVSRRTRLRARLIVAGGLAAVIMLSVAVALIVNVIIGDKTPHLVHQPAEQPRVVARLTNAQDAVWQSEHGPIDLTVGDELLSGRTLTLTHGIAELTTNHGAIARLKAPCTIELIDNDNALRLASGTLVGVVESAQARGFLVRTPHMDVTDLGTRFGVDATDPSATEVHVFEGEVRAKRTDIGAYAAFHLLVAGQAMRAVSGSDGLVSVAMQADRFPKRLGTLLLATGQGRSAYEVDDQWRVVAVDGRPVTEHGGMTLIPEHENGAHPAEASQWLRINAALNPPDANQAVFTCRGTFDVPPAINNSTHEVVIRCQADFSVMTVRINGQALPVPNNRIGNGWITLDATDLVTPGSNTIEIDIREYFVIGNAGSNRSALRVEVEANQR